MTIAIELTETMPLLLESLERGDEVRFLKNGQTVARLTPTHDPNYIHVRPEQTAAARNALARAQERSKLLGLSFDVEQFKADRDSGRR